MKFIALSTSILVIGLTTTPWVAYAASSDFRLPYLQKFTNRSTTRPPRPRAAPARVPALATKDAKWTACVGDAAELGPLCGTVDVPLDRKHLNQGVIAIYFELYTHPDASSNRERYPGQLRRPGPEYDRISERCSRTIRFDSRQASSAAD